jgi:hypothetical protein
MQTMIGPHPPRTGARSRRSAHLYAVHGQIGRWLAGLEGGRPDWCVAPVLQWALLVPADGGSLRLAVGDGVPVRGLPRSLASPIDGEPVPLAWMRAPRPRAQSSGWPANIDVREGGDDGTVAALVRYAQAPQRYGLLTAGHVLAGRETAQWGDSVFVSGAGMDCVGSLSCWQPAIGSTRPNTEIDAALAEIDPAQAQALFQEFHAEMPRGVASGLSGGQLLTVRTRTGPKRGTVVGYYNGLVDIAATSMEGDFFIQNAVACKVDPQTEGGDSGSAVWDEAENLLGVHCAGVPETADGWNALFSRIGPVLGTFGLDLVSRGSDGITPAAGLQSGSPGLMPALDTTPASSAEKEIDIVARTLWGEARGEGEEGMRAVACVIVNRRNARRGSTLSQICRAPAQFSCWNEGDPNRLKLLHGTPSDAAFEAARRIASEAQAGSLTDITFGARHYHTASIALPRWARGHQPCLRLGSHLFYNDVA